VFIVLSKCDDADPQLLLHIERRLDDCYR